MVLANTKRTCEKKSGHSTRPRPERAFGDALREIRKEHCVSQERHALDSGLDRTYVSLLERGVQSPTLLRTLAKLAGTLGVKCSDIVIREWNPSNGVPGRVDPCHGTAGTALSLPFLVVLLYKRTYKPPSLPSHPLATD